MSAQELASALQTHHGPRLRRQASRFSLCPDDAEDAVQRTLELALTRAPASLDENGALRWAMVVSRREALRIRRLRERILDPPLTPGDAATADVAGRRCELLPSRSPGPLESAECRDRIGAAAHALARLRPAERRAIGLQAAGLSYAEICAVTGWTHTKVNRCLAEGRARLRAQPREP